MSDPDKVDEDKSLHDRTTSPVHGNSIVDMEQKMREQIRILQEQRAAVMMNEVIELQREKDLALGRVKTLKNTIQDLTMENTFLKGTVGKGDLAEKVLFLKRSCVEEQFLSNDLRKKLQVAHKLNSALTLKVQKLEMELATSQMSKTVNTEGDTLNGEHSTSNSLSNLDHREKTDSPRSTGSPDPNVKEGITASVSSNRSDFEVEMKSEEPLKRKFSSTNLLASKSQLSPAVSPAVIMRSGSSTPQTYSPTVISRRYKLAAAACRDAGTQTVSIFVQSTEADEESRQTEVSPEVSSDVLDILEIAKKDIIKLQKEKEQLESELLDERSQRQREKEKLRGLKKELALLKAECLVLKESLSEFSLWTRQKMQLMEEDMDIFKVVYSLHGSLSQEKAMLNDLREKLTKAELKIQKLDSANSQLMEEVSQTEDKYKRCKKDLKYLRKKSTFSSSPNFSTPPYYLSPSQQHHTTGAGNVSPVLHPYRSGGGAHSLEVNSSPLLTRTSPPLKSMFPVRVAYDSKNKRQDTV